MRTEQTTDTQVTGEVVSKRRFRSKVERRRVVEETLRPGASVAVIAREHGVNANQVFHWRKLYRQGRLDVKPASAELIPVRIIDENCVPVRQPGTIHIELGSARVRVEGAVDSGAIRAVLEILRR